MDSAYPIRLKNVLWQLLLQKGLRCLSFWNLAYCKREGVEGGSGQGEGTGARGGGNDRVGETE